MPELQVRVTEAMIQDGTPQNCRYCPVALALIEAGAEYAKVYTTLAVFDYRGKRHQWSLPFSISLWIEKYDKSRSNCGPFSFTVPVPDA